MAANDKKMYRVTGKELREIADAIRSKNFESDLYPFTEFAIKIEQIPQKGGRILSGFVNQPWGVIGISGFPEFITEEGK